MGPRSYRAGAVGLGIIGLSLTLAVISTGWIQETGPSPTQEHGVRIGVVDIQRVLDSYEKSKAVAKELESVFKSKETQLAAQGARIKALTEELAQFNPDSPDYKRVSDELIDLRVRAEAAQKKAQSELTFSNIQYMKSIYKEIQVATGNVAKANKLHYVINQIEPDTMDDLTDPRSILSVMTQPVVYSDHSIDLTDPLIDYLNRWYASAKQQSQQQRQTTSPRQANPGE